MTLQQEQDVAAGLALIALLHLRVLPSGLVNTARGRKTVIGLANAVEQSTSYARDLVINARLASTITTEGNKDQ